MDTKCSQVVWTLAEHTESPPVGQSNRAERELLTLLGRQDVSARAGRARAEQARCGGEDMPAAPCGVRKRAALCGVVKCEAALCVVIELCCPAAYNLSVCASVGFHLSFYRRFPESSLHFVFGVISGRARFIRPDSNVSLASLHAHLRRAAVSSAPGHGASTRTFRLSRSQVTLHWPPAQVVLAGHAMIT
jgi:hypothetical protein